MVVIVLYFALFLAVHFVAKSIQRPGAAKLFQLACCFVLLTGFFCFRDITVLNDTPHYYGFYYQKAHNLSYRTESIFAFHLLDRFEWGFQVYAHLLVKYVSRNPYTIIMVSSLLIIWGNLRFVTRQTSDIALATLMMLLSGIYFDHHCLIRQAFVLLFFYYAFEDLQKGHTRRYVVLMLLAALFHLSALVLLVLPLMQRLDITRRNLLLVLGAAVVFALSVYTLFNLLGLGESTYFRMNIKRNTLPVAAIMDGMLMLTLLGACYLIYRRMGLQRIDRTLFWTCVFGICVCIVTPSFLSFFRLNVFIWPIVYMTFFRFANPSHSLVEYGAQRNCMALRESLLTAALVLLLLRMTAILLFRNEWYHLVPYTFYDFGDQFHNFNMYWDKEP